VERTFRVAPGRDNRAMAGLSMGGAQTFGTALANLDKFATSVASAAAVAAVADSIRSRPTMACSPTRRHSTGK
jgi:S-formylglutathione hydrolase FrmB